MSSDDGGESNLIKVSQSEFLEQNRLIEKLTLQVQSLQEERNCLKREVDYLKKENADLKRIVRSSSSKSQEKDATNQSKQSWKLRLSKRAYSPPIIMSDDIPGPSDVRCSPVANEYLSSSCMYPIQSTPKATSIPVSCLDCGSDISTRETSTHGESTCYQSVEQTRNNNANAGVPNISVIKCAPKKTPQRMMQRRIPRRTDSGNLYELSADLREKNLECLEKKYGGKEHANRAALVIQQCYRHWALNRSFIRMRNTSVRKRSITLPEKHFGKLNKTSLVFYGPENPVMIIDEENKFHMNSDNKFHMNSDKSKLKKKFTPRSSPASESKLESKLESLNETAEEVAVIIREENSHKLTENKTENNVIIITDDKKDSINDTTNDSMNDDTNDNINDITHDDSKLEETIGIAFQGDQEGKVVDGVLEDVVFVDESEAKVPSPSSIKWHNSSDDSSSQYDIIDDSQVLTVVGKEVDTTCGSRISVDTIHDDTPGGWVLDDTTQQYEPTFDKSMHKRQFRIGVNLFNWKPAVGIDYLVDNEHIEEDVKTIAEFLRKTTTISKQKISEYFSNLRDEFIQRILLEFAKSFEFAGKGVDEALRQFQSYFKLTGEAQTVEKFLQVFSDRYVECNPDGVSDNPDNILLLAFALAMLNTDLHNQNVKRRMTLEEFLRNLRGTNDGIDFDQQMLSDMYTRIHRNEFATGADHTTQLHQIENSFIGKKPNLADTHRQFVKLFTLEEVIDPSRKDKPHTRLCFLFNDLLILAKPRGKGGIHGSGHMFSCKGSYPLLGKKVAEFNNEHYPFGVMLLQKIDGKGIATFNMKDEDTKKSFVDELDEYIRETNGMENIRIALSKTNQLAFQNRRKDPNRCKSLFLSKNSISSQDSGFHGMDKTETVSLLDLRIGNSLEAEDVQTLTNNNTIVASSSMNDIDKDDSEENYDLVRTGSSSSLDPAVLSDSNSNMDKEVVLQPSSATLPRSSSGRKSLFAQIKWRKVNSPSTLNNTCSDKKVITTALQQEYKLIPTTLPPPLPP